MPRLLSIAIVCFWLAMVALLVRRVLPPPPPKPVSSEPMHDAPGDEWMGVYHEHQKIGYTHRSVTAEGDGFVAVEESLLRLTIMEKPQTVRTHMQARLRTDYALREMDFDLSSGVGTLQATGVVTDTELRITLRTGRESSQETLPLQEPIYLPSTLRTSLGSAELEVGRQFEKLVFDPTTLKNDRLRVTVEDREAVPQLKPPIQGWRVREEFRGLRTLAWIDASGGVLREEGPMGLILVRETAEQAINGGWVAGAALDLMATAAVPVTQPIEDPRHRQSLRLRLSGVDVERVPSDSDQMRHGSELVITRPEVDSLQSYALPYQGAEHAADLMPTSFLQSDHPRVQAVVHEAVGAERDAKRVATQLNDWVYGHLRKVPTISIPNALQVLDMGEGDCNEHAVLFAALGRAAGLPTRVVAGAVYLDGAFFYHAWCEVWLNRWVSIDPALHQFPADATHIKFVVGGLDEQTAMLAVIGRLGIEVLDDPATAAHH